MQATTLHPSNIQSGGIKKSKSGIKKRNFASSNLIQSCRQASCTCASSLKLLLPKLTATRTLFVIAPLGLPGGRCAFILSVALVHCYFYFFDNDLWIDQISCSASRGTRLLCSLCNPWYWKIADRWNRDGKSYSVLALSISMSLTLRKRLARIRAVSSF